MKHHLARGLDGGFEPGVQLAELADTPDDAGMFGSGICGGRLPRGGCRNESIAAAVQGLDEARLFGIVIEDLADLKHGAFKRLR